MSCADDLTLDDLNANVTSEVLERVSAGEGSNSNLWGSIDRDKYAAGLRAPLTNSVNGVNLVDPESAPKVIKTWDDRLEEEQFVESGVDDEVGPPGYRRADPSSSSCTFPSSRVFGFVLCFCICRLQATHTDQVDCASSATFRTRLTSTTLSR